ncbi:hypothetical protein BGLA2_2040010 [Burkholderia gladioli]|nr:hypothetical protein BGLA2_2040010 [Burkholderia gladioli]
MGRRDGQAPRQPPAAGFDLTCAEGPAATAARMLPDETIGAIGRAKAHLSASAAPDLPEIHRPARGFRQTWSKRPAAGPSPLYSSRRDAQHCARCLKKGTHLSYA